MLVEVVRVPALGARAGAGQHQRAHALWMIERDLQRGVAAHRQANEMRAVDLEMIEHGHGIAHDMLIACRPSDLPAHRRAYSRARSRRCSGGACRIRAAAAPSRGGRRRIRARTGSACQIPFFARLPRNRAALCPASSRMASAWLAPGRTPAQAPSRSQQIAARSRSSSAACADVSMQRARTGRSP